MIINSIIISMANSKVPVPQDCGIDTIMTLGATGGKW